MEPDIKQGKGGIYLNIHVVPNSSSAGIKGLYGKSLKIRLRSLPKNGRANKEALRLISDFLGLKPQDIEIVKGASSRDKKIFIRSEQPGSLVEKLRSIA
jgi:hypothetical protein